MKWFKHLSHSLDDPFIFDLISEFGSNGYLVFFGFLEIISQEFDESSPGFCQVSVKFSSKKLQLSKKSIKKILEFCKKRNKFDVNFEGELINIKCNKFKDLCDEYTKRIIIKKSGQCRDNVGTMSGVSPKKSSLDKDKDKDKDIKRIYRKIIDYLNLKTGKNFKTSSPTKKSIMARINEKWKYDDFVYVIDIKCNEWLNDKEMNKYLRPITLFGTKFESYRNQKTKKIQSDTIRKPKEIKQNTKLLEKIDPKKLAEYKNIFYEKYPVYKEFRGKDSILQLIEQDYRQNLKNGEIKNAQETI